MRRVVVTGLGIVSPLGCGVETTWERLLAGVSGAKSGRRVTVTLRMPDPGLQACIEDAVWATPIAW